MKRVPSKPRLSQKQLNRNALKSLSLEELNAPSEVSNNESVHQKKLQNYNMQIISFFESPFHEDKKFVVHYIAELSKDLKGENDEIVASLFYDRIFNIIIS
jgi:hypothetical protein